MLLQPKTTTEGGRTVDSTVDDRFHKDSYQSSQILAIITPAFAVTAYLKSMYNVQDVKKISHPVAGEFCIQSVDKTTRGSPNGAEGRTVGAAHASAAASVYPTRRVLHVVVTHAPNPFHHNTSSPHLANQQNNATRW